MHPRAHREVEVPLGLEPVVWVPVSLSISEGPFVYLYCVCARTRRQVYVHVFNGMRVHFADTRTCVLCTCALRLCVHTQVHACPSARQ